MEPLQGSHFITTLLPLTGIVFVIALGVITLNQHFRKNLYRKILEQEELKSQHQQELLRASIEVQEGERKRIAHDIHDEIGALLTTSRLYFNQLSPGRAEEQLQQVSSKINSLFDEMMLNIRRISHDLRPVVLENLGLAEAIESLRDKLSEASLELSFTHQLPPDLTPEAELILYRILQELIGNTLKHAHATRIDIDLRTQGETLLLDYSDNGIGIPHPPPAGGLGMKSIRSRLSLLNGTMQIAAQEKGARFLLNMDLLKLTQDADDQRSHSR